MRGQPACPLMSTRPPESVKSTDKSTYRRVASPPSRPRGKSSTNPGARRQGKKSQRRSPEKHVVYATFVVTNCAYDTSPFDVGFLEIV